MKKKCLYILLAGAMSLSLCACSGKKNVDTPALEAEQPDTQATEDTETETELVSEAVTESESDMPLEETMADYAGIWKLDKAETEKNLKGVAFLRELFGESVDTAGGELTITEDGSMTFYIGDEMLGEGSGELTAGWIMTSLEVTKNGSSLNMHLIIAPTSLSSERYLLMTINEEVIYWKWESQLPEGADILLSPQQQMEILADVTGEVIAQYDSDEYFMLGENAAEPFVSSVLSYSLKTDTLMDCGDHYLIEATLGKPVTVSGDLQIGDQVTFTINELTGETATAEYESEGLLKDTDGAEYYYWPDNDEVILTEGSDDRVDAPFYEGAIRIRKDAVTGAAIMDDIHTVTEEDLMNEDRSWFNGVAFDEEGYATALIFFGD